MILLDSLLRSVGLVRLSVYVDDTTAAHQACSQALNKLYFQKKGIAVIREVEQLQADKIAHLEAVITEVRDAVNPALIPMTTVSGFVQPKP